ncbi:glycosyltransferase family 2 protein [Shewanella sp. A25]|nr:glycosyltransferase family 2 protein [Shewanella shenzhenensis]
MKKLISYCIPVMNRADDIKSTLVNNINVANKFSELVEVVVHCFDTDNEVSNYVHENFSSELNSGLLIFRNLEALPFWHFCWAKNSFKNRINGKYYASLDGDNYISDDEVIATINLCKDESVDYMIHLFSGKWGDGTSGRVVTPTSMYQNHGYMDTMFPRQFDEMALILSILNNEKITFVSRSGVNIFELSGYARDFKENALNNDFKNIEVDFGEIISPLMPRGEGYAEKDPKLNIFQGINSYFALHEISHSESAKQRYAEHLKKQQEKVFSNLDTSSIEKFIFQNKSKKSPTLSSELTVYAVIKDDTQFLETWYHHYKSMGVTRFIIIDDNSKECVSKTLKNNDVYVFTPRVGNFKLFKTFWIKTLCSLYQKEHSWILTLDSDELLDITPLHSNSLLNLVSTLEDRQKDFCGGILIDMMPEKECDINSTNFSKVMNHHLMREPNEEYGYQKIPSIKWAFSDFWKISFSLDLRFRLYGSIDSLRKFPLVKYRKDINFNQGFHGLGYNNKQVSADEFFEKNSITLPLKHYKFLKFINHEHIKSLKETCINGYHSRTKDNISKIIDTEKKYSINLFYNSIHKKKYSGNKIVEQISKYKEDVGVAK